MSQWTDRIEQHPMFAQLGTLDDALARAEHMKHPDGTAVELLGRLQAVASALHARLNSTDLVLLSPPMLDGIASHLATVSAQVSAYVENQQIQSVAAANQTIDNILPLLAQLGMDRAPSESDGGREAVVSFRRTIGQYLKNVDSDVAELRVTIDRDISAIRDRADTIAQRADTVERTLASQEAQVSAALSQFQSQFGAAQERRIGDFSEAQSERKEAFDTVVAERAKTFDVLINEQKETSAVLIADAKDKLAKLLDASHEHHEADRNEMKRDADQILAGLRGLRSEAEQLLGVIGTIGVTSGYQKVADAAGSSKRKWQVTAVVAMLGLIGVAWLAFLPLLAGTFQWESFAGRVFVSLTVGVLAAYAAHQADRYQTIEQRNRRLELELASVGPFLEPLPVEKQEEFKYLMAERIFGRADGKALASGSSPATVIDLLQNKEVRDALELMSAFSKTVNKVSGV